MSPARPMPRLVLPLALFGLAVGYMTVCFVGLPFVASAPLELALPAALMAGALGAAVGFWLGRARLAEGPFGDDKTFWARLVLGLFVGGPFIGGAVGWLISFDNAVNGTKEGAVAAVLFLPLAILVVSAARRARRARLGSLVAATDEREVWSVLAAGLGLASAGCAVTWTSFLTGDRAFPIGLAVIVLASVAVVVTVLLRDARARRQFNDVTARGELEARPEGAEGRTTDTREIDLGLGEGLSVEVERRGAYRDRDRVKLLVVGDLDDVRRALRRALRRDLVLVGLTLFGLVGHMLGWSRRASLAYDLHECRDFSMVHCADAFATLEERGELELPDHADVARRACDYGEAGACLALAEDMLAAGKPYSGELGRYVRLVCDAGNASFCDHYARAMLKSLGPGESLPSSQMELVAHAMEVACKRGNTTACDDAPILRVAASDFAGQQHALGCFRDPSACRALFGSEKRSVVAQARACKAGDAYSCFTAASARYHELGFAPVEVLPLFAKACDGKIGFACCEAAFIASTWDREAAPAFYAKADALGFSEAGSCELFKARQGMLPSRK